MSHRGIKLSSPLRRRRLFSAIGYASLLIVGILFGADHFGSNRARDDWSRFDHQSFRVTKIIDGDTINITDTSGNETTVRLLGIDAPEMLDPTTNSPAHWAERAMAYMAARAGARNVIIRLEPIQTRDRYDRLLAYIYLSDGDCLNMDIVRDGQAFADRRFRHSYRPQYEQAENEARKKERGLWKGLTEEQMPAWRRVWLDERNRNR